jgi:hypothetical protein
VKEIGQISPAALLHLNLPRSEFAPPALPLRLKPSFLTGQVLDSNNPNANMKDVSVMLVEELEMSAQTVTNASGEFQLEFNRSQNSLA